VQEEKLLNGNLSETEQKRVEEAVNIMFNFEDNFYIYHLPDPNVAQLRVNLKRYIYRFKVDAIFFDYIHTSPNLLSEFAGAKIREDVALMLLSTALKNIANEHNVFVWTGTQINGTIEPGVIAGVETIRGSRAIMDKVDAAMVLRAVTPEDLKMVAMLSQQTGKVPTHTIDFFKNRRGRHNKVRLWIILDLGNVNTEELFLTDQYGGLVSMDTIKVVDSSAIFDDITPLYSKRVEREKELSSAEKIDLELKDYVYEEEPSIVGFKISL
jgi:replicative DNA helicase